MNKDLEISFRMSEEEKERIKKILLGSGGLRHYLLKLTDGTELDVVNYEEYKKLEEELNAHIKGLCEAVNYKDKLKEKIKKTIDLLDNYQNNLYSKTTRETLDDDIERAIKLLKGENNECI